MYFPYILASASLAAFFLLWFTTIRRELSSRRRQVQNSAKEVAMHEAVLKEIQDSVYGVHAETVRDTSRMIYRKVVLQYDQALNKPVNRIPGFIMGFRFYSEEHENIK